MLDVIVDFPTPPFADDIAITFLTDDNTSLSLFWIVFGIDLKSIL